MYDLFTDKIVSEQKSTAQVDSALIFNHCSFFSIEFSPYSIFGYLIKLFHHSLSFTSLGRYGVGSFDFSRLITSNTAHFNTEEMKTQVRNITTSMESCHQMCPFILLYGIKIVRSFDNILNLRESCCIQFAIIRDVVASCSMCKCARLRGECSGFGNWPNDCLVLLGKNLYSHSSSLSLST